MSEIQRADMNFEEARATCDTIRRGLGEIRDLVLDLHDRKGWSVLGYKSWRECVVTEFDQCQASLYRHLKAAQIEAEISNSEKNPIPEKHLIALAPIEPGKRDEVFQEAKATAPNGKMTEKHVKETVDRKLGKPKPEPKQEIPRSQYKAEVNGKIAADPPDVARLRASGKIGPGVMVEITEPEPDDEPEPRQPAEPEPTPEADPGEPEEEWLEKLPLSSVLTGMSLAIFQSDARRFYRMKPARDSVRHHNGAAGKGLRKDGEYLRRVTGFLKLADPRDWIKCPTIDNGGCNGTGQIEMIGACPKCFGRGYTIDNRRTRGDRA